MTKERKEQYKTLAVLCIGFAFIAWRLHSLYLFIAVALVLVAGLVSPYMLRQITTAWLWVGEKIGAVMSRVILSVIFFLFLTPIAIAFRLFSTKKLPNKDSFFTNREHTYTRADMEQTF
jgi:hypothetical protein